MQKQEAVAEIRAFNRFYTRVIGVIDSRILRSPYSLLEARILFEVSRDPSCNARGICRLLRCDEGYLSRAVEGLRRRGLLERKRSREDGRIFTLSLSERGRQEFTGLDSGARRSVSSMIGRLTEAESLELVSHMRRIRELLA